MGDTQQGGQDGGQRPAESAEAHPHPTTPRWQSESLLQGHREVLIEHAGEVYRLRCTRNGKLILHK